MRDGQRGNLSWPLSGDSWMYPYQRTPMGNPYISPIYPYSSWVFMGYYPQESLYFPPYKYHGSTRTLGVHPSLSLDFNPFLRRNCTTFWEAKAAPPREFVRIFWWFRDTNWIELTYLLFWSPRFFLHFDVGCFRCFPHGLFISNFAPSLRWEGAFVRWISHTRPQSNR